MELARKSQGVVSIFLIIILVPMLTITALYVDASRVSLGKSVAESAGDLALNTALTDYDTVLKDMYGIFATAQNTEELYSSLEDYYRKSITSTGVSDADADSYVDQIMSQLKMVDSNTDVSDVLNMSLTDFNVQKRTDATLADAPVIKKQIVDFMKYRAPINLGMSFLTSLQSFTTLSKQTDLVDKRKKYYDEQKTVMEHAHEAWKDINQYNKLPLAYEDNYLSDMQKNFKSYEKQYTDLAKKIVKDLYDTEDYLSFKSYSYHTESEEMIVYGVEEKFPVFYTNDASTSKLKLFSDYDTYDSENQATVGDVRNALYGFKSALDDMQSKQDELNRYDLAQNVYPLQLLVQLNRNEVFDEWVTSCKDFYNAYNRLIHTASYVKPGVMGSQLTMEWTSFSGTKNETNNCQYFCNDADNLFTTLMSTFNNDISKYNSKFSGYANTVKNSGLGNSAETKKKIEALYKQVNDYRTTVISARDNLSNALEDLQKVYEGVKPDGPLEEAKGNWKSAASDSDLKNTSTGRQDLAEIKDLSTFINPEDVNKMINRLTNIKNNLQITLDQIDSYMFYDTYLTSFSSYDAFVDVLEDKITKDKLKSVPFTKSELESTVNSYCDGKFTVGKPLNTSWSTQSGTQVKLYGQGTDKLNFYTFLYTQFNMPDENVENSTKEKEEDTKNGEDTYDKIESKGKDEADAGKDTKGNESDSDSQEIKDKEGLPSKTKGNNSETPSVSSDKDKDAVEGSTQGLGAMFSSLGSFLADMATELRDKLYVSDYILNMFSYDTVEKEYDLKHKNGNPASSESKYEATTLTLYPLDKDHNLAYGKEVEYIIFGGSNSSNLTKSYGSIFGIRLGFNLIYAFTCSEIRETAFSIATPISAASLGVIPVPLIQAAIIIGIACCESALDLVDLKAGKSVPLYKTKKTFRCCASGMIKAAKETALSVAGEVSKDFAESAIDDGVTKLKEFLDMTDDQLNNYINEGTTSVEGYVGDAYDTMITTHANTAIQKLTTLANSAMQEHAIEPATNMVDYVSERLDSWLTDEAVGVDTENDLAYIAKKEAVNIIKEGYIESVIETLESSKTSIEETINNAGKELSDKIVELRERIIDQIRNSSEKIKNYKTKMIGEVKDSVGKGADSLKSTINAKLDGVFGKSITKKTDNDSTGVSSLLSFAYSDYMRLFLLIGQLTNEEGILLRTADVIQVNMAKKTADDEYRLSNASEYVEITATIQVKPTLLALPLFADVENNPVHNTNWYTFEYKNIRGY